METILEFLKNWQELLTLAGIVATLLGGGLILKRVRTTKVFAKNQSVAVGGDVNIGTNERLRSGGTRKPKG